jgi:hypothetical protein
MPEEKARREAQIAKLRPGSIKDTLKRSIEQDNEGKDGDETA